MKNDVLLLCREYKEYSQPSNNRDDGGEHGLDERNTHVT